MILGARPTALNFKGYGHLKGGLFIFVKIIPKFPQVLTTCAEVLSIGTVRWITAPDGEAQTVDSAALKQRRMFIRQSTISGPLPGRLVEHGTERKIEAWPLDVSPRGLALLIKVPLTAGVRLSFFTEIKTITLEVVNCQAHLGIDNLYRVGLFVRDPDENLHLTFQKLGLLTELTDVEVFSRFL